MSSTRTTSGVAVLAAHRGAHRQLTGLARPARASRRTRARPPSRPRCRTRPAAARAVAPTRRVTSTVPSRTSSLTAADRERTVRGDALGDRDCARASTSSAGTTALTRPSCVGARGGDRIAGERHLERDAQRDPRAEERAAAGREQPALHLGQAELRVLRRDDHVAAEQQLEAAGDGGAVGRADERHGRHALEQPIERARRRRRRRVPKASPAANARRSMPAQNARSPVPVSTTARMSGVSLGVDDGSADRPDQLGRQRVARLRTVEPGDEDRAALLAHELGVGARSLPL